MESLKIIGYATAAVAGYVASKFFCRWASKMRHERNALERQRLLDDAAFERHQQAQIRRAQMWAMKGGKSLGNIGTYKKGE